MDPSLRPSGADLERVRSSLGEVRDATADWLSRHLDADREMQEWSAFVGNAAPEAWRRLEQQEEEAREDAERRTRDAAQQAEQVRELTGQVAELRQDEAQLGESLGRVELLVQGLREANARAAKELENEVEVKRKKINLLRGAMNKFKDALGLRFNAVEGSQLKVTFTLIDPVEPQREFSFLFHSDDNKVYHASQCDPPVERLPELLQQLNSSNSVPAFFKAMRNEFRQIVKGS